MKQIKEKVMKRMERKKKRKKRRRERERGRVLCTKKGWRQRRQDLKAKNGGQVA